MTDGDYGSWYQDSVAMLITLFSLISANQNEPGSPNYIPLTIYPSEIYNIMFGNWSKLYDMNYEELPDEDPLGGKDDDDMIPVSRRSDAQNIGSIESIIESFNRTLGSVGVAGQDEKQFNELNLQIYNLRRGRYKSKVYFQDKTFSHYDHRDTKNWGKNEYEELKKIRRLKNLGLQFMIHCRYKIAQAMKQREPIRYDKRYMLGYLFCRLRRTKTEMLKILAIAHEHESHYRGWHRRMMTMMRLYEEIIRMEVDVHDTTEYIKEVYNYYAEYDYVSDKGEEAEGQDHKKRKKPKRNKP